MATSPTSGSDQSIKLYNSMSSSSQSIHRSKPAQISTDALDSQQHVDTPRTTENHTFKKLASKGGAWISSVKDTLTSIISSNERIHVDYLIAKAKFEETGNNVDDYEACKKAFEQPNVQNSITENSTSRASRNAFKKLSRDYPEIAHLIKEDALSKQKTIMDLKKPLDTEADEQQKSTAEMREISATIIEIEAELQDNLYYRSIN